MFTFLHKINIKNLLICVLLTVAYLCISFEASATQSLESLFDKALNASKNGSFYESLALWDEFLNSVPDYAAAFSNRGNVRLILGDAEGKPIVFE